MGWPQLRHGIRSEQQGPHGKHGEAGADLVRERHRVTNVMKASA